VVGIAAYSSLRRFYFDLLAFLRYGLFLPAHILFDI